MAEPTGSIIRMPKVENALGQSTTSATSQKAVTDGINQAKSAASTADGKAVTAQKTANEAKTAADNAQKTANEAKTAAGTAQTAANNANSNANGRVPTSRKINGMDLTADLNLTAAQVGALTKADGDARYQLKGQASGVTLGVVEKEEAATAPDYLSSAAVGFLFNFGYTGEGMNPTEWSKQRLPANVVVTNFKSYRMSGSDRDILISIEYRRITGGI